ncbi:MAG: M20/M25/M40 family metallo-hydrolase [Ardenticatenales bacterium]
METNVAVPAAPLAPSRIDAFRAHLERHFDGYMDLLKEMVDINSFTRNPSGVNRLGELTALRFADLGFDAEQVESGNPAFGAHVVLSRGGRSGRTVGLVTHLDTVFPADEEAANDFRFRVDGDRIYGPGTVDIKGGTVMIYMVMDVLRACAPDVFDAFSWDILLDAAEEAMSPDFGALLRERLARPGQHGAACLVFEGCRRTGDDWHIVTRRKGMAVARITVEGRGAHAGGAHGDGANAIVQLARLIDRAAAMTDPAAGLTVNVGTVAGGTVTNRVPHAATARLEMRAERPEVLAAAIERLRALAETVDVATADGSFTCRAEVRIEYDMPAWPTNEGTEGLYAIWAAAAADVGMQVEREARGGLSDGNWLWADVPTLDGLGPHGDNLHCSENAPDQGKTQEYATRSSFVPKAVWNAVALCHLASDAGLV